MIGSYDVGGLLDGIIDIGQAHAALDALEPAQRVDRLDLGIAEDQPADILDVGLRPRGPDSRR